MTTFEEERTTVFQFMQCLQDIVEYMGRLSHGKIFLDTSSQVPALAVPITSIEQIHECMDSWSENTDNLCFVITRKRGGFIDKRMQIEIRFKKPSSILYVEKCQLTDGHNKKSNAENRGDLRDLLCAFFAPSLKIFPILHFLLSKHPSLVMKTVPYVGHQTAESPECCTEIENSVNGRRVLIALDANDYNLVTWDDNDADKVPRKIWSLSEEETKEIGSNFAAQYGSEAAEDLENPLFPGTSLLFLSYILGFVFTSKSG